MKKEIEEKLENVFGVDIDKIHVKLCSEGDVNTSWIARYEDQTCFIKEQGQNNLPTLYENQIAREMIGTKLCREQGIPCPDIIACDLQNKFIITEFLPYEMVGHTWENMGEQQRLEIKTQALKLVEKMNQITFDQFGAVYSDGNISQYKEWTDSYRNIVGIALADCRNFGSLTQGESDHIMEIVDRNSEELKQSSTAKAVFAHLDFHWNNIFWDAQTQQIKGVIDFGSSLSVPEYMGYYRLDGGFLYGTERFYDKKLTCPINMLECEVQCADLLNTLDYFTFLSYKNRDFEWEKKHLLGK
ncbi:phosphotransferase [Anaerosporobacter faecicola]|uniref:phosphotransferase n=1 Tax=Anaerosporobacter faecicola TaxID=2718714 RepID=UPI001EE5FF6A|nr:phosphotransferase [Anaerosporobacter faecicola]